jgi:hypothetical protein
LAVEAGNLSYLIDEVQYAGRDIDNFAAHNLEELTQQLASFLDEVDGRNLVLSVFVDLLHQEFLHVDVVVFAEELQEPECPAKSQFIVEFSLYFKFIRFMSKHLDEDALFLIEVIVGIDNFVRKISLFLIIFELSHLNQEISDILDQQSQTHESHVC